MSTATTRKVSNRVVLQAETAADLMTANPISIGEAATLEQAVAFLTAKAVSAAPVVDEAGRPIGVLSQTDIVIHDRNKGQHRASATEYFSKDDLSGPAVETRTGALVRDLMTPVVLSVSPRDSALRVVGDMVALQVHRLFVVDNGVLVGVISTTDVLRKLGSE